MTNKITLSDAVALAIVALEKAPANGLQSDALNALQEASSQLIGHRSALICVRHDYAEALAHIHDLMILSQLSRMEYEQKSLHIKGRLKMIDLALGESNDTANP